MDWNEIKLRCHIPYRLRRLTYFEAESAQVYFDEARCRESVERAVTRYEKQLRTIHQRIAGGECRVKLSVSGVFLEQCVRHAPRFVDSLRKLMTSGRVDVCSGTYFHAAIDQISPEESEYQIHRQALRIEGELGIRPEGRYSEPLLPVPMNRIQRLAVEKVNALGVRIRANGDGDLLEVWRRLLSIDHILEMDTRTAAITARRSASNANPYESFVNYMNVLRAIEMRISKSVVRPVPLETSTELAISV